MSEELSKELINEIRKYVYKNNSKIDVSNKFGVSYDTVVFIKRIL